MIHSCLLCSRLSHFSDRLVSSLQWCCTKCYGLANYSVKNVSVTLWFCLQRHCKTFCSVRFYQPALYRTCVFVLWTSCLRTKIHHHHYLYYNLKDFLLFITLSCHLLLAGVTGKFAWNNLFLYRKQTGWNTLKPEAARTKIKDYNQSKLTISQLT